MKRLFCFGLGFSARALVDRLDPEQWQIAGTCRRPATAVKLAGMGISPYVFDGAAPVDDAREALAGTTHLLVSIPPDAAGDLALRHHMAHIAVNAPRIEWLGYLSTIGVYGDHEGGWVDEDTPVNPVGERGKARVMAENQWLEFGGKTGIPVHVFRLPGIYGPGRNALVSLENGKSRSIIKPGQVFNRIHVEDLARVLQASMAAPDGGCIYNVVDDEPAPPQDVSAHAARLLGVKEPQLVDFKDADLSPMARSFYGECKRVRNRRIKTRLGVRLNYPDYRKGLAALFDNLT